jgi:hypothetical protein
MSEEKENLKTKITSRIEEIVEKYDLRSEDDDKTKLKKALEEVNRLLDDNRENIRKLGLGVKEIIESLSKFFPGFNEPVEDEDGLITKRMVMDSIAVTTRTGPSLRLYFSDMPGCNSKVAYKKGFLFDLIIRLISKIVEYRLKNSNKEMLEVVSKEERKDIVKVISASSLEMVGVDVNSDHIQLHMASIMTIDKNIIKARQAISQFVKDNFNKDILVQFLPLIEIEKIAIKVNRKNKSSFGILMGLDQEFSIDDSDVQGYKSLDSMASRLCKEYEDRVKNEPSHNDNDWFIYPKGMNPSEN